MPVVTVQPEIRLSVADGSQSIGHIGLWVRSSATAGQGRAALAELRSILPSDCVPVYGQIRYERKEESPAAGAGDGSICGVFIFETAIPDQYGIVSVPGLRPGLIDMADPMLIDRSKPSVSAFISALQSGQWANPFGYVLTNCIAAMVQIKKL